jgi:hypothetical protein
VFKKGKFPKGSLFTPLKKLESPACKPVCTRITAIFHINGQIGCLALGIWIGFLKQPALPGEAPPPQKKKSSKKILKNKNH